MNPALIGTVWREVDGRFTRHVQIVSINAPGERVGIKTVSQGGAPVDGMRTTYAKLSAFGKRYKPVEGTGR